MVAQLTRLDTSHDPGRLIAKAVVNAGRALGLSQKEVARAIGVSEAQVSKFKGGSAPVSGKADELSRYLIRIFRSLDAITGGDPATTTAWMRGHNTDLRGVPAEMIATAAGLVEVMTYLDAARAPL
ncbi:MAG: antitoxin Xre/MbcA/ParS toxin-binding domain-containing protein [Pseudomonadota bacterium]